MLSPVPDLGDGFVWFDHAWVVNCPLTLHNNGTATAPDAIIRFALPTEHVLLGIQHESDFVVPEPGAAGHLVFSTPVSYPIYPGIPRPIQTVPLQRNLQRSLIGRIDSIPPTTVKIYYQVGHSQGVNPAPGKWSPLAVHVHFP